MRIAARRCFLHAGMAKWKEVRRRPWPLGLDWFGFGWVITWTIMIPVASRSKAWICDRSPAGTAGSNPAGGMDICLLWVLWVFRQRGIRVGTITRPEESYRGWCVQWVWSWSPVRGGHGPESGRSATGEKRWLSHRWLCSVQLINPWYSCAINESKFLLFTAIALHSSLYAWNGCQKTKCRWASSACSSAPVQVAIDDLTCAISNLSVTYQKKRCQCAFLFRARQVFLNWLALKLKATHSSGTLRNTSAATRRHIPEKLRPLKQRCKNLKSRYVIYIKTR